MKEELQIEGVRAPHSNSVTITAAGTAIGNGHAAAAAAAAAAAGMAPHTITQLQVCIFFLSLNFESILSCFLLIVPHSIFPTHFHF